MIIPFGNARYTVLLWRYLNNNREVGGDFLVLFCINFIEFVLSQIDKILDDISVQISEDNEQLSEYTKKLLSVMEELSLIRAKHLWKNWG